MAEDGTTFPWVSSLIHILGVSTLNRHFKRWTQEAHALNIVAKIVLKDGEILWFLYYKTVK